MAVSIILAIVPTVLGMVRVFTEAANNERGIDATQLSDSIAFSLIWTVAMMPFAIFGLTLLIIGIFSKSKMDIAPQGDAS